MGMMTLPVEFRKVFSWRFFKDLIYEIKDSNITNGAAALAYYLTLAIFPALILLLSLIPYLPVAHVDQAILELLMEIMPVEVVELLSGTVNAVTSNKSGGLISFGALATLWAASNGAYATMQQLNETYSVKEGRSFLRAHAIAIGLTILVGVLIIVGFSMIVLGGHIQEWMEYYLHLGITLRVAFALSRWAIILAGFLLAFSVTYYFGPDVEQKFKWITPGSALGVLVLIATSMGFRAYVTQFGNYSATYGSIGAVIVLMLWLYISGLVVLGGSELNALAEHYSDEGKNKGEKQAS